MCSAPRKKWSGFSPLSIVIFKPFSGGALWLHPARASVPGRVKKCPDLGLWILRRKRAGLTLAGIETLPECVTLPGLQFLAGLGNAPISGFWGIAQKTGGFSSGRDWNPARVDYPARASVPGRVRKCPDLGLLGYCVESGYSNSGRDWNPARVGPHPARASVPGRVGKCPDLRLLGYCAESGQA